MTGDRSFSGHDLARLEGFIYGHARTITCSEFHEGDHRPDAIMLRHDVDNDPEQAVLFAQWEADRDIRSTYFLLPTASYWPRAARDTALALAAMGHEVGVHNDALCAAEGDLDRALALLSDWATEMRSWGLTIRGCADHGGVGWKNTDMWRVHLQPLSAAGLEYEAYLLHQQETNYISDNRGTWRAPMRRRSDRPTHMLIHPEHWPVDRPQRMAA